MANIATKFGLGGGGPFLGAVPPSYITGCRYRPYHIVQGASNITTTITRLYYTPIYVWESHNFAGAATYNAGAGDNGEVLRLGLYTHSATNGPTTLVKDFGEITLTGAAAERVLTSATGTLTPGWYWTAQHHNTAASMYSMVGMGAQDTAVGYRPIISNAFIGEVTANIVGSASVVGRYVDTAYGAFATTAVAPTTENGSAPLFWLVA